jgi:type II secretory pathway component PulK
MSGAKHETRLAKTSLELKQANDFNCKNIRNLFQQQLEQNETRLAKTIAVAHTLAAQNSVDTFELEETKAKIEQMQQKIHELTQKLQSIVKEKEKPPRGHKRKATASIQIDGDLSTLPIRESKK